jgi:hypothetical protein
MHSRTTADWAERIGSAPIAVPADRDDHLILPADAFDGIAENHAGRDT